MAGESYDRAYGAMVSVQMLSELEEIIQYKLVPERREIIKQMWWDRLQVGILGPNFENKQTKNTPKQTNKQNKTKNLKCSFVVLSMSSMFYQSFLPILVEV